MTPGLCPRDNAVQILSEVVQGNIAHVYLEPLSAGAVRLIELQREWNMAWTTPVVEEVCVGMEVTSYSSAEV